MIVLLDAGPLGFVSNPSGGAEATQCRAWLDRLTVSTVVCMSEVADYEVRRELLRGNKAASLARLDQLGTELRYLAIDTATMRRAAELWAIARNRGRPTAAPEALDADVIIAAQAQLLHEITGDMVVVATGNVRHLAQFVDARRWQEIEG